jgi:hypothetical protein
MRSQLEARQLAINQSREQIGKVTASFGIAELMPRDRRPPGAVSAGSNGAPQATTRCSFEAETRAVMVLRSLNRL